VKLTKVSLQEPYLVFLGDVGDDGHAKTGHGLAFWAGERCVGQLRFEGCPVETGLPDLGIRAALDAGVRTVVIGVAPAGGQLPDSWLPALTEFARNGVDVASGLHSRLSDDPQLVSAAAAGGARLVDVRVPPPDLPCGTGKKRSGKRVLTVGTDCAVGKKYTALALHRELVARGVKTTFRATGQTGILIAGEGMPIDAVVADFLAGAAEALSPDNDADHWDVIEGQGSLMHPSYAGVTLGIIHGSQPDAVVVCHDATRKEILGLEGEYPLPPIAEIISRSTRASSVTNAACRCVGISVNTSELIDSRRLAYLAELEERHGVPAVDPVATGIGPVADYLLDTVG